jgi:Ca-activated chloride channel family protein
MTANHIAFGPGSGLRTAGAPSPARTTGLIGGTPVAKLAGMQSPLTSGPVIRTAVFRTAITGAALLGTVLSGAIVLGPVLVDPIVVGAAQQATFRSGTQFVPVLTTVTDAQGRLVPDLDRDQFTILDNGKPQNISLFENEVQPFTAVVTLDFSASMTNNLELLKQATEQFLIRMLREDKAQVGSFSDKIQFSGTFTSDRDDLIGALGDLQFGNPTRLYDAIDASIEMLQDVQGRKVVVVFTDGEDTASHRSFGDALNRAKDKEVMVYAIGLESELAFNGRVQRTKPDRGLRKLAEETGGGYFELKKTDDLGPTFSRVVQELHSLYTIGFNPPTLDGKEHKLEVRIKQPGMNGRARKSYIATAERLADRK